MDTAMSNKCNRKAGVKKMINEQIDASEQLLRGFTFHAMCPCDVDDKKLLGQSPFFPCKID